MGSERSIERSVYLANIFRQKLKRSRKIANKGSILDYYVQTYNCHVRLTFGPEKFRAWGLVWPVCYDRIFLNPSPWYTQVIKQHRYGYRTNLEFLLVGWRHEGFLVRKLISLVFKFPLTLPLEVPKNSIRSPNEYKNIYTIVRRVLMWSSGVLPEILMLPTISYLSRYLHRIWIADSYRWCWNYPKK